MQRRTWLALAPVGALAACGFRLAGVPSFAFKSLFIAAPTGSSLAKELRRTLEGAGSALELVLDPAAAQQAEVILELPSELRERVIVGQNASGQVRELQLRLRVKFRLRSPEGEEWIAATEIAQARDVSYNETIALAKEAEEALLFRNMQTDIVQQLLRRLAAVRGPLPA